MAQEMATVRRQDVTRPEDGRVVHPGVIYRPNTDIYEDDEQFEVRLTPGNPIRGLTELPRLASARRDQRLTLLFYVTDGAEIETYALGNKAILEFDPPIRVD